MIIPDDGLYYIRDENNDSSFFKSYYSTGDFTSLRTGDSLSCNSLETVYKYTNEDIYNLSRLIYDSTYIQELNLVLYKQIYIAAIAVLETYLSDTMASWVFSSQDRFDKYIGSQNKPRISLCDFIYVKDHLEDEVYKDIQDRLYHRLDGVRSLFKKCIGITIFDVEKMEDFIRKRHDLVHRNGKDKEGNPVSIQKEEVINLLQKEQEFIKGIYDKISLLK